MFNFINNYKDKKRWKKARVFSTMADGILSNKGVSVTIIEWMRLYPDLLNRYLEDWKEKPYWYIAAELYKMAALIYPEDDHAWQVIVILCMNGKYVEAYNYYEERYLNGKNVNISEYDKMSSFFPCFLAMLIAVGENNRAYNLIEYILSNYSESEKENFSSDVFF